MTLVDSGCTPSQIKVPAGPVTFDVTNGGTSKVSEMELKNGLGIILGESENVVEGVPGRFSLNLKRCLTPRPAATARTCSHRRRDCSATPSGSSPP